MVQVIRPSQVHRQELERFFARRPGAKGRTIGVMDAKGHKQGESCFYRMGLNGPYLVSRDRYKDDRLHGMTEKWYATGQLQAKFFYDNDRFHGVCQTWYADGNPEYSVSYKHGAQDGLAETWYPGGQQKNRINYQDGFMHGSMQRWYGNGQIETSAMYHQGILDGVDQGWYANGHPHYLATYRMGQKHGAQAYWYDNGQPLLKNVFKDGKQNGLCVTWDEKGDIEDMLLYANGRMQKSYHQELFALQKQDMLKARFGIKCRDASTLMQDQITEIVRIHPELLASAAEIGYMPEQNSRLRQMALKLGL